jgi:hypothetical protein
MGSAKVSFARCLSAGKIGENLLIKKFDHLRDNTQDCERNADIISTNNTLIEVKYCMSDRAPRRADGIQKNILLELWKNMETKQHGGPWKAQLDGCKYFVQIFKEPEQVLLYDVDRLVSRVNELRKQKVLRGFSRHTTFKRHYVYIVPRTLVTCCLVTETEFLTATI